MARECDILVENFKVGGLAKYGLDYASLKAINPRLIYCSITGFGQTGPYAERPGYDFMIQAMGGMMSLTGERDDKPGGGPQKAGVAVADLMTGMYATSSILAALFERSRSGLGQHIDIALLDCQVAMLANQNMNYLVSGQAPKRAGNAHQNLVPYQVFPTKDGHIIVAIGNNRQFAAYCEAIGHPEVVEDERFRINSQRVKHRDELEQILSAAMQKHPSAYWLEALDKIGVPAGPINDLHGVFSHPQVQARNMRIELAHSQAGKVSMTASPMRFSDSPVSYRMAPPQLGEHTEQALQSVLGADSPELKQWRDRN
jgi:crotonobetainyl-CoA:carnitine CoA-transferase CaiB-like acyl-CoA transferase